MVPEDHEPCSEVSSAYFTVALRENLDKQTVHQEDAEEPARDQADPRGDQGGLRLRRQEVGGGLRPQGAGDRRGREVLGRGRRDSDDDRAGRRVGGVEEVVQELEEASHTSSPSYQPVHASGTGDSA